MFEANATLPIIVDNSTSIVIADTTLEFISHARSASTLKTYKSDLRQIQKWLGTRNLLSFDDALLADYMADQAGCLAYATLTRRLASLRWWYSGQGVDFPIGKITRETLKGIARVKGTKQIKKTAAESGLIMKMIDHVEMAKMTEAQKARDRMLILLGFATAMRRSELVVLKVGDITFTDDGAIVHIARSKTDQFGQGYDLAIVAASNPRYCVLTALTAWLDLIGHQGLVMRQVHRSGIVLAAGLSTDGFARVVKRLAKAIGEDAAQFGAHSLRAGAITSCAAAGASIGKLQELSRHKSADILLGYIRSSNRFQDHAMKGVL